MAKIEPHILKTAQRMLDRYGDGTLQEIDLRIRELQAHGEESAAALWTQVRAATQELLDGRPASRPH